LGLISELHQGDIILIEHIKHPVLVVSKDLFNSSGSIIGCPIFKHSSDGPLHIPIVAPAYQGYAQCENLAFLDMKVRGYRKIGSVQLLDRINISDAIQSIFEYV